MISIIIYCKEEECGTGISVTVKTGLDESEIAVLVRYWPFKGQSELVAYKVQICYARISDRIQTSFTGDRAAYS